MAAPSGRAPSAARPAPREGTALGRDPFDEAVELDPMLERLDRLEARSSEASPPRAAPQRSARRERSSAPGLPSAELPPSPEPTPLARRRWASTPSLADVELPESRSLSDYLLDDATRRALAALAHLVEGEGSYDRFGFSPEVMKAAFPFFHALYRVWFRVRSEGHENLPVAGPAILAGNHGGLLPFDGAMAILDIALHTDPPRLARAIVDRWAGALPWVNVFYARVGQVIGTRENFADLLDDGQLVLVFPEGMEGVRKPITERYRLQQFRVGFIEQALSARAPIVPVAFLGSDDQAPILYDAKPLARALGLPMLPITPTFPWLGPIGLLPYPVSYRIVYGEPLRYYERFGPEAAGDARLVRYLANQVRRAVQQLVDRNR